MCGIAGAIGDTREHIMRGMLERIAHRGPDGRGYHCSGDTMIGNVRLSVIDVAGGQQPMSDSQEECHIVYNGELYGYQQTRRELAQRGYPFRTTCDTEVVLALYREQGMEFLAGLDGMFALCIVDTRTDTVILARDHFGIKPLIYTCLGNALYFASEVKALYALPQWEPRPDWDAWHTFFNIRFPPAPHTLFAGVWKIPAGCCLMVSGRGAPPQPPPSCTTLHHFAVGDRCATLYRYYRLPHGTSDPGRHAATDQLRLLLEDSVRKQCVADVPTGVYLSGGLDSASLVALGSAHRTTPLTTFCLGFNEPTDENRDAALVAQAFGTRHHDRYLDECPLDHFAQAVYHLEEPKVNGLQGFLLAREARRHRTVMLSGLGGDELFGGYDIYAIGRHLDRVRRPGLRHLSEAAGVSAGALLRLIPEIHLDNARRGASLGAALANPLDLYLLLRNGWDHDQRLRSLLYQGTHPINDAPAVREHFAATFPADGSLVERFMRFEFQNKMVDDFLANEDKNAMAHGLEVRVPFLDRGVVEAMTALPLHYKIGSEGRKLLLRHITGTTLPPHILRKRKHGFTFNPVLQFDKDLRGFIRHWLCAERVAQSGVFNYRSIERILNARPCPALRWHYFLLWKMAGYQVWEEVFIRNGGRAPMPPSPTKGSAPA